MDFQNSNRLNPQVSNFRLILTTALVCFIILQESKYTFGLYSQALANQMNYTQNGVQFMYNLSLTGGSVGCLIAGALLDKGGPPLLYGVAAILHVSGYLAAAFAVDGLYDCPEYLMWAFGFFYGFAESVFNVGGFAINARNFPIEVRGKVLGITSICSGASVMYLSVFWETFFLIDPDNYTAEGHHVSQYFKFVTGMVAGLCILAALTVRIWDIEEEFDDKINPETEAQNVVAAESYSKGEKLKIDETLTPAPINKTSGWTFLKLPTYWYFVIVFCIFASVDRSYMGEIGRIGESLGRGDIVSTHFMAQGVCVIATRVIVATLYDRFRKTLSEWFYILCSLVLVLVLNVTLLIDLRFMFTTYLCTIGYGMAAVIYFLYSVLVTNRYGSVDMANAYAVMSSLATPVIFVTGAWNTAIYNSNLNGIDPDNPDRAVCYGTSCFQINFMISIAAISFATVLFIWKGRESNSNKYDEQLIDGSS